MDQHGAAKMTFRGETVDGRPRRRADDDPPQQRQQMPLDYRMHNAGGRWQVYDLSIDGISLVANYRAQFNKIIRTDSYEALVAKLKSHQAEFAAPAAARPEDRPRGDRRPDGDAGWLRCR